MSTETVVIENGFAWKTMPDGSLQTLNYGECAAEIERLCKEIGNAYHKGFCDGQESMGATDLKVTTEERPRDIDAVIARLRFGDSDGDDHDIAAREIERLRVTLERIAGAQGYALTVQAMHNIVTLFQNWAKAALRLGDDMDHLHEVTKVMDTCERCVDDVEGYE